MSEISACQSFHNSVSSFPTLRNIEGIDKKHQVYKLFGLSRGILLQGKYLFMVKIMMTWSHYIEEDCAQVECQMTDERRAPQHALTYH